MLKKLLRESSGQPLNWDKPGRAVRIGWRQIGLLNTMLVDMVSIATHSEGMSAEYIAPVQIHPFARSTTGRGRVNIMRFANGFHLGHRTVVSEHTQFVSVHDVRRLAVDIMHATDEPTRTAFRNDRTPTHAIVHQVLEDTLATIAAGSVALQMGIDVDENQLSRKRNAILFEYRKRKDAA